MKLFEFFLSWFISTSIQENTAEKGKCVPSCPESWEKMEGHCYMWSLSRKSWPNAELFCNDQDGHLASVTNQEIHNYMKSKVNTDDSDAYFWVGGTDKEHDGSWNWTDGSAWDFTQWATWPRQQPDGWDGEDCLLIYDYGQENGWNDQDCSDQLRDKLDETETSSKS